MIRQYCETCHTERWHDFLTKTKITCRICGTVSKWVKPTEAKTS